MKNKCPACGHINNDSNKIQLNQGKRGLVDWKKCSNCKSYFSTAQYDKSLELNHVLKNTSWGKDESGKNLNDFKDRMYTAIAKSIFELLPPPATLLDIGCSFGGFLFKMKDKGYKVEGLDIVPEAVGYLSECNISAGVGYSIKEINNFDEKKFDIITVLDCNCYWDDQKNELGAIYSKLKTNGLLVLRVVDKSNYFTLGKFINLFSKSLGQKLMRVSVNDHRFSMPIKSLKNILHHSNYSVVKISAMDAIYSNRTKSQVKILFILGNIIRIISRINFAPGLVIIAKKK